MGGCLGLGSQERGLHVCDLNGCWGSGKDEAREGATTLIQCLVQEIKSNLYF